MPCIRESSMKGSENEYVVLMHLSPYILSFFSLKFIIQEMDGGIQAFSYLVE
jgi:hypothetical protein